jgi:hypothetical protein
MTGAEAFAAALVIIAFLAGPIGTAIGRRISGNRSGSPKESDTAGVAEFEQRLRDLEAAQARIAELEERMDFAERMLANPRPDQPEKLASRGAGHE